MEDYDGTVSFFGNMVLAINEKNSENVELAWDFLKYCAAAGQVGAGLNVPSNLPTNRSSFQQYVTERFTAACDELEAKGKTPAGGAAAAVSAAVNRITDADKRCTTVSKIAPSGISDKIQSELLKFRRGTQTETETLANIQNEVSQLLSE